MKQNIVIVGLGLIGGSLAKAFQKYSECTVTGIDADPAVLEAAISCGAVSRAAAEADLEAADVLFLCLYPGAAVAFVEAHGAHISKNCVVTDVCGVKAEICRRLPPLAEKFGFTFVGGHPMAGKERNGFSASDADLFLGASYLLVPCGAPRRAIDLLTALAVELGFGGAVVTTPERHDAMIAFTSQVPHALACAYVMSPRCPDHPGYSAGSYRDVSRVARINETLWAELFLDNAGALAGELDTLLCNLSAIRDAVAARDAEALRALLRRGREIKEALGE